MKKFNYFLIGLAFITSLLAVVFNFDRGYGYWAWPLATCLWVVDAWVKQRKIDELESR